MSNLDAEFMSSLRRVKFNYWIKFMINLSSKANFKFT